MGKIIIDNRSSLPDNNAFKLAVYNKVNFSCDTNAYKLIKGWFLVHRTKNKSSERFVVTDGGNW